MSSQIPSSVVEWLLEPDCPPVRFLTLTHLLGRPATDRDVRDAAGRLGEYEPTRAILAQVDQYRDDDHDAAYRKYTGRYWQLIFLGQFRAGGDPRVGALAERLVETRDWTLIPQGGQCLTANLLHALSLLGYGTHPVVREATIGLAERIVEDGGIACGAMDYSLLPHCFMAQPKLLLCFSHPASLRRHRSVSAAIDLIREKLLDHGVYRYVPGNRKKWLEVLARKPGKAELRGATVKSWVREQRERFIATKGLGTPSEKPGWLKLGFPLNYNSDLLEALYALALCGVPADERLEEPLGTLRRKLMPDGRCLLENSLNGKMRADVETVDKPSKWLTYRAWYVLRHLGERV